MLNPSERAERARIAEELASNEILISGLDTVDRRALLAFRSASTDQERRNAQALVHAAAFFRLAIKKVVEDKPVALAEVKALKMKQEIEVA